MSKPFLAVALLLHFILVSPLALGSGGMAGNFGTFTTGVSDGENLRYIVELDEVGQLLRGKPSSEIIDLITIHAPGTNVREILVRESRRDDGKVLLFFSAPDNLTDKFQRATIYLKPAYSKMTLIENIGGRWEQRNSISIPLVQSTSIQTQKNDITAFQLFSLGENWLMDTALYPLDSIHNSSSSNNITSALWPWFMSGMLLVFAWLISHCAHALGWRGGR